MYYAIKEALYVKDYILKIAFKDDSEGYIDFNSFKKDGVFSKLNDVEFFKQFYVNEDFGTLCWPDNIDIAPETLYSLATGKPLPKWMAA